MASRSNYIQHGDGRIWGEKGGVVQWVLDGRGIMTNNPEWSAVVGISGVSSTGGAETRMSIIKYGSMRFFLVEPFSIVFNGAGPSTLVLDTPLPAEHRPEETQIFMSTFSSEVPTAINFCGVEIDATTGVVTIYYMDPSATQATYTTFPETLGASVFGEKTLTLISS